MGGILAFGTLLDAISNAISLVNQRVAVVGSLLILGCWAVVELAIKKYAPVWRGVDGADQRITRLGTQPRLFVVGMLMLLWIPAVADALRQRTTKPMEAEDKSTLPTVTKDLRAPPATPNAAPGTENDTTKVVPPSTSPERSAPAARQGAPQPRGPTQTMINSPGGIQASGDVTITSDRRVLNAITVRVSIETQTSPTTPSEPGTDAGLQSVIAFFTKDKTRIRFATNFMLQDHQVSDTRRRLTFTYTPETPEEILGKPVEYIGSIDVLVVNYAEIFRVEQFDTTLSPSKIAVGIAVNGIAVGSISMGALAGVLSQGQATFKVAEAFTQIPATYEKAVAQH